MVDLLGPLGDVVLVRHWPCRLRCLFQSLVYLVEDGDRCLWWQLNLFPILVRLLGKHDRNLVIELERQEVWPGLLRKESLLANSVIDLFIFAERDNIGQFALRR